MMKKMAFLMMLAAVITTSASAGTVAYWRFEEGPLNEFPAHGGLGDGQWYPGALDSSGNGYDLSIWGAANWCGERYRAQVPMGQVPLTGAANNFALQRTGDLPGMWTNDPTFDGWTPLTWTVEAWCRAGNINRWQSVVGRDGENLASNNMDAPVYSMMFTDGNAILSRFVDMSGTYHEIRTGNNFAAANRWYHVVATSDGANFILYVDGVEVARKTLATADTRMHNGVGGNPGGGDWHPGAWTVFRGMWNGGHSDRWWGSIDEVRVSDVALTPAEFLNSGSVLQGPNDWAVFPEDSTTARFTVTAMPLGQTVTDVAWYKDAPDPNTLIIPDGVKYSVNTTATDSTLTVYNVTAADEVNYKAVATFSDASTVTSTREGHLSIRSGLVHRYSFDSDVSDSVGTAHGTVVDPNNDEAFFVDGQLLLDNPAVSAGNLADVNEVAYVELPQGIISSLGNYMTIEMWLTPHRNANWTTFFAFGDTWNAEPFVNGFTGAREGLVAQLNRDQGGARGPSFNRVVPDGAGRNLTTPTALTLDEQFMYAVTWDGNTNEMRHYVNGVLTDTDSIDMKLSEINDVKCWLGLPFWADPVLNASINELRIYDTALPGYYVYAHSLVGPDVTAVELKPVVAAPAGVAVYPALRADDADVAQFVAAVTDKPAGSTVAGATWYKDPDPAISGDEVMLADDAKYDISFNDEDTTLTINGVNANDEAYYYATVTLGTGAEGTGGPGKLVVSEGLSHRWSFNGDLTDSVGGADGTLVDPSGLASFAGGQLVLENPVTGPNTDPDAVAYVSLPAGIVSPLENYATIMMWVTPDAKQGNWVNLFAFGSDRDGDPRNYTGGDGIIGSLRGDGRDAPLFSFDIGGAQRWQVADPVALSQEFLFAMVWDGNSNTGTLYIIDSEGTQVASAEITGDRVLANVDDTANIIGGNWWNDYMLDGSINEMRIYDWPFEQPWIQEFYKAGPEVLAINPCMVPPAMDVAGGGLNGDEPDCQITMADFAVLAAEWLDCGRLEPCN